MLAELDAAAVREALAERLAASHPPTDGVIWVRDGDEVVVWLDSLDVRLEAGILRVRVDLETEQTGRAAQEIVLAVAEPDAPASLLAVSDDTARGDALLAARWGRTAQDAVWGALLDLAGPDAVGIAATEGALVVHAREPG